jgi:phage shock protein A
MSVEQDVKVKELEEKVTTFKKALEHANMATEALRAEIERLKNKLKGKDGTHTS